MKLYYVCDYCDEVFSIIDCEGSEGNAEVRGVCEECALEIGLIDSSAFRARHFYS